MGFLDRFKGEAAPSEVSLSGIDMDIVGESYYQKALESIAGGKTEQGFWTPVTVELRREPKNPHDKNAVQCVIDGQLVAYINREAAAGLQKTLAECEKKGQKASLQCHIVGGWKGDFNAEGDYGVKIDPPVPTMPGGGPDPAAALLATYNPNAKLGPAEAAELGAKIRAIYEQSQDPRLPGMLRALEEEAGKVRAKHYTEWINTLDFLRNAKDDDKALVLLAECIDGAERAARVAGREPAPSYTERAAIIYRRRKDYAEEIGIIERWEAACPAERRGPGATQEKLAKRLADARRLKAQS